MASGASSSEGQFVGVSWGFHGILVCSRVFLELRWKMFERILEVGGVRNWPYLAAKPSQVGVHVEGTSCLLCHPTTDGRQPGTQSLGFEKVLLAWLPRLSLEESLTLRALPPQLSGQGTGLLDRCCLA
jgi:hypothetical protein